MIVHITLFRFRDDVLKEEIDKTLNKARELKNKINVIKTIYWEKLLSIFSGIYRRYCSSVVVVPTGGIEPPT